MEQEKKKAEAAKGAKESSGATVTEIKEEEKKAESAPAGDKKEGRASEAKKEAQKDSATKKEPV